MNKEIIYTFFNMNKALIGAGCFWGVEEYFRNIYGIESTKVGYSGGNFENPTYEDVCRGTTNHAEVILLEFNEKLISYKKIIDNFWNCHDPTQLNKQGLDIGTQYRSVIFYFDNNQKVIATDSKNELQKKIDKKVETEIAIAKKFYVAEDYHQCFLQKRA